MLQPRTLIRLLLLTILLATGQAMRADNDALREKMDSVRRELPSLKGEKRRNAWKKLYNLAYYTQEEGLSMRVLNEWLADAHHTNDYEGEAIARQNKLVDCYNTMAYDSVVALVGEARDFCSRTGLTRKYFEAWHLLACAYHVQGQYNTVIREVKLMHEEAVKADDRFGQSMAYFDMGNVYYSMRHFDQAVDAFEQSVALLQHEDSITSVLFEVYPYYGDALEATKNFDKLESMTREWWSHIARRMKKGDDIDLPPVLANYYVARTQALLGLGRKEEAREALAEAEKNIGSKDSFEWLYALYYKAQLAKLDGRYDEALQMNDERIKLFSVIDDTPTLIPVHLQRAEILLAAGRYKEAAQMYRQTYEMSDSLNTMQTRTQLNEMKTLFQVDELHMQNVLQQNRYINMIGIIVSIALLGLLIQRLWAVHRLKQKNEQLARSNQELTLAKEQAQESSKMKTAFIRSISHEIRTPLNILNGFTQVLVDQDGQLNTEEAENIRQGIQDNAQRITELVNKMLEMSDASSHAVIERTDTVSASCIADDAVAASGIARTTAPESPTSPVSFAVQSSTTDNLLLTTNRLYAQRALRHLLENARKFTQSGSVTLRLAEEAQAVAFIVEDTGIGIPAEDRERIFGEFVKLDDYASGTGIGLPLARGIVRKLGGDITLDVDYTGGARFVMTLPKTAAGK